MNEPLVSICCQTYNHKNYIRQALDSFLMQKTNFSFEILLRDDASTDGTAEICKNYASKYPDLINLLAYEENQFSKGVKPFADNVKRARGKYIALCEGDDYWTDPYKLQKQVDFLEKNEEISFCYHNVKTLNVSGRLFDANLEQSTIDYYTRHEVFDNKIPTLSIVFRNVLRVEDFLFVPHSDIFLFSLLAQQGDFANLNFTGGVRRINDNGVFSGKTLLNQYKNIYITRKRMIESDLFDDDFKLTIRRNISKKRRNVLKRTIRNFSPIQFIKVLFWVYKKE